MLAYMVTNKLNNKSYIGITTRSIKDRWYRHVSSPNSCGRYLHRSIKTHGKENFEIKEIASCIGSLKDLKELEKDLIGQHNTFSPNGYNLTKGGDGLFGYKPTKEAIQKRLDKMKDYVVTEETKQKMRESHSGDKNHFFGKSHSEETKKRISETKKAKPTNFWLGKQRDEVTRKKIADSLRGRAGCKHTPESKMKLSLAHKGKKGVSPSEETRKKLSEAVRISWIKRRENLRKGA